MKKVLDQELEKKIEQIIQKDSKKAPQQILLTLKDLQDASGLKVCTAITKTDVAYREVK